MDEKSSNRRTSSFSFNTSFYKRIYDGDGVCRYGGINKGFLGTYDLLNSIKNILKSNTDIKGKINICKQNNIYEIRLAKADTLLLNEYMYNKATVFLKRKR